MAKTNWIEIQTNVFTCIECENTGVAKTNTEDGIVDLNFDEIKKLLQEKETAERYAICSICGMEYKIRLEEGKLYLEPADELK